MLEGRKLKQFLNILKVKKCSIINSSCKRNLSKLNYDKLFKAMSEGWKFGYEIKNRTMRMIES